MLLHERPTQSSRGLGIPFGVVGVWLIIANHLARSSGRTSARWPALGVLTGVLFVMIPAGSIGFIAGDSVFPSQVAGISGINPVVLGLFVFGLFGYFIYPIWAISIGRSFLTGQIPLVAEPQPRNRPSS